jgi:hypothetical protein
MPTWSPIWVVSWEQVLERRDAYLDIVNELTSGYDDTGAFVPTDEGQLSVLDYLSTALEEMKRYKLTSGQSPCHA